MQFRKKSGAGRKRFSPLLWLASLGAVAVLALGVTGTLSQLAASITNNNNNATTGGVNTFQFSESLIDANNGGAVVPCVTASAGETINCTSINKYGANGAVSSPALGSTLSNATTVRLTNTANPPAGITGTLSLTVPACSQNAAVPPAGDLCAAGGLSLTVNCDSVPATATPLFTFTGTLDAFEGTHTIGVLAPGQSAQCAFTITAPDLVANPQYQDITATQPLTWTFTQ